MNKHIIVNLPVADLPRSLAFFESLGFSRKFRDDASALMVVSEAISVMLHTHEKFCDLSSKDICDTTKASEAWFNLGCESRAEVDDLVSKAVAGGGSSNAGPEDYGFMYQHGFADPDGHHWVLFHMTENAAQV